MVKKLKISNKQTEVKKLGIIDWLKSGQIFLGFQQNIVVPISSYDSRSGLLPHFSRTRRIMNNFTLNSLNTELDSNEDEENVVALTNVFSTLSNSPRQTSVISGTPASQGANIPIFSSTGNLNNNTRNQNNSTVFNFLNTNNNINSVPNTNNIGNDRINNNNNNDNSATVTVFNRSLRRNAIPSLWDRRRPATWRFNLRRNFVPSNVTGNSTSNNNLNLNRGNNGNINLNNSNNRRPNDRIQTVDITSDNSNNTSFMSYVNGRLIDNNNNNINTNNNRNVNNSNNIQNGGDNNLLHLGLQMVAESLINDTVFRGSNNLPNANNVNVSPSSSNGVVSNTASINNSLNNTNSNVGQNNLETFQENTEENVVEISTDNDNSNEEEITELGEDVSENNYDDFMSTLQSYSADILGDRVNNNSNNVNNANNNIANRNRNNRNLIRGLNQNLSQRRIELGKKWKLQITINSVDIERGLLSATLKAKPDENLSSFISTYLEGEIIDYKNFEFENYSYITKGVSNELVYWCVFKELRPLLLNEVSRLKRFYRSDEGYKNLKESIRKYLHINRYYYMKWKERFFFSKTDDTFSIAGLYFVRLDRETGNIIGFYKDSKNVITQVMSIKADLEGFQKINVKGVHKEAFSIFLL